MTWTPPPPVEVKAEPWRGAWRCVLPEGYAIGFGATPEEAEADLHRECARLRDRAEPYLKGN